MFLGSDEMLADVTAARQVFEQARAVFDDALAKAWEDRPPHWTMGDLVELVGCTRTELVMAIGRSSKRRGRAIPVPA